MALQSVSLGYPVGLDMNPEPHAVSRPTDVCFGDPLRQFSPGKLEKLLCSHQVFVPPPGGIERGSSAGENSSMNYKTQLK